MQKKREINQTLIKKIKLKYINNRNNMKFVEFFFLDKIWFNYSLFVYLFD